VRISGHARSNRARSTRLTALPILTQRTRVSGAVGASRPEFFVFRHDDRLFGARVSPDIAIVRFAKPDFADGHGLVAFFPQPRRKRGRKLGIDDEFQAAGINAREKAGMTQAQVARRMGTTQSVVARIEGGGSQPNLKTLQRYAEAVGRRIQVKLVAAA